ncbi:MAG: hypothetical protein MJ138_07425 [Kiritimatiellae bacterium]|nr:hypothetical protein [Kiritimatiellia bacterium]
MKKLVLWFVKKYALEAVKDAVSAKSEQVSLWATKVAVWLGRARLVVAFLERLNARLIDGQLSDDEAVTTIDESKLLADQVLAK